MQIGQPQTKTQLYSAFQDDDPPATITPETMRNLVASVPIIPSPPAFDLHATVAGQTLVAFWNYFNIVDAGGVATLPTTGLWLGVEYIIWNFGANNLTLLAAAGDAIETSGTFLSTYTVANGAKVRLAAVAPGFWAVSGT